MADAYEMATERICEILESGVIPWQQPWEDMVNGAWSGSTGKPYSFLNQMLLLDPKKGKTFEEMREAAAGEWYTFAQVKALGGRVKKGEHGRVVVFYKPVEKKNEDGTVPENPTFIPFLRYYTVFNVKQCEGIEQKHHLVDNLPCAASPVEAAENTVNGYVDREGVRIVHQRGDRACYSPTTDTVTLPEIEQFVNTAEYYSTLFHELTHSTGHEKRLARNLRGFLFDQESYSTEELVAEIGSASICLTLGLDTKSSMKNSAAYVQGWLRALKNDKKMIVYAAGRAEKAVKLILGVE